MRLAILMTAIFFVQGCQTHRATSTTRAGESDVVSAEIHRETEAREVQDRAEEGKHQNWLMDAVVRAAAGGLGNLERNSSIQP